MSPYEIEGNFYYQTSETIGTFIIGGESKENPTILFSGIHSHVVNQIMSTTTRIKIVIAGNKNTICNNINLLKSKKVIY